MYVRSRISFLDDRCFTFATSVTCMLLTIPCNYLRVRVPTSPLYFCRLLNKCKIQDIYLYNIYVNT